MGKSEHVKNGIICSEKIVFQFWEAIFAGILKSNERWVIRSFAQTFVRDFSEKYF